MINKQPFPNYMQIRQRVPQRSWQVCRFLSVGIGYGLIITAFTRPEAALFIFWRIIVPLLPLVMFVAPGIWRNICPMGALNQAPRMFRFGRSLPPPAWLKNYAALLGILLFVVLVPTRKELFNTSGPALGILLFAGPRKLRCRRSNPVPGIILNFSRRISPKSISTTGT